MQTNNISSYQSPYTNINYDNSIKSPKSKIVALILCIFFGGLGIHKFYVGKIGMGILYFFTAGLFGIGWIIDIIIIATGHFKDKNGLLLKR